MKRNYTYYILFSRKLMVTKPEIKIKKLINDYSPANKIF